jgi:transposase
VLIDERPASAREVPVGPRGLPGPPRRTWSRRYRARSLASLRFADRTSQLTIPTTCNSRDVLLARRERIEDELTKLASDSPSAQVIRRLRALRGTDTISALGPCAEIGEFDRFDHADLSVPRIAGSFAPSTSPTSSAIRVDHRGRLRPRAARCSSSPPTTTGCHPRSAMRSSAVSATGRPRSSTSSGVAQLRLNDRWRQLKDAGHKPNCIVAVAIARELAGFCWG